MAMSPRLLLPRKTIHPEAADWANRVRVNGGTLSNSAFKAVDTFCKSIDSAGLRSRLWRVSPMAGDNLSAALVPLYRSNVALGVLGNATDTNDNFVSTDYDSASGLVGNGSNKRLRTGLPVNFNQGRHFGCFPHTLSTVSFRTYMGAADTGVNVSSFRMQCDSPTTALRIENLNASTSGGASGGVHAAGDFIIGASNGLGAVGSGGAGGLYANGTATGSGTNFPFPPSVSTEIGIFCEVRPAGTFAFYTTARIGGYSIGDFLTPSQVLAYSSHWNALLRSLGRKA